MAMGKAVVLAMVMALIATTSVVDGAVNCGRVAQNLGACRAYLGGPGGAPSAACCAGVRALNGMARTTPDRQQACNSIKSLAAAVRPNIATAKSLPSHCGINIGVTVDPTVDCSRIR